MKKIILSLVLISFSLASFSQMQPTKEKVKELQSNAEIFSARAGVLIQKEFEDLATIKKCKVQLATLTDLLSKQKTTAIRFEYVYQGNFVSELKTCFVDADEIDGLIKSLQLIQEKILPTVPTNYTEVSYKSRSGFEAGCFLSKGSWSAYLRLDKFDSNSYVFIDRDGLSFLITTLQQAKSKL